MPELADLEFKFSILLTNLLATEASSLESIGLAEPEHSCSSSLK